MIFVALNTTPVNAVRGSRYNRRLANHVGLLRRGEFCKAGADTIGADGTKISNRRVAGIVAMKVIKPLQFAPLSNAVGVMYWAAIRSASLAAAACLYDLLSNSLNQDVALAAKQHPYETRPKHLGKSQCDAGNLPRWPRSAIGAEETEHHGHKVEALGLPRRKAHFMPRYGAYFQCVYPPGSIAGTHGAANTNFYDKVMYVRIIPLRARLLLD